LAPFEHPILKKVETGQSLSDSEKVGSGKGHSLQKRFSLQFAVLTALALGPHAFGQSLDTSGNGSLKGSFRFRHLAVQNVDNNGNATQTTASFGVITFDGAGNYTVNGTVVDTTVSGGAAKTLTATGTYAIGSNGIGYVANPLYPTDTYDFIYGAVAQGVFIGSSSESGGENYILNDLFVAIPAATNPTLASLSVPYQVGVLDFSGGADTSALNALFKISPNGAGALANITLTGYAAKQGSSALTQNVAGATYLFNSDSSGTLTVPLPSGVSAANALFTGTKTMFVSADGNFILGWTPAGYDLFFGVKAMTASASNATATGLVFTAALESLPASSGVDSYYGSDSNSGNTNGDSIIHQRLNLPGAYPFDYGSDNALSIKSDGTSSVDFLGYSYALGAGGTAWVGVGTSGFFSLMIGLHAPNFTGNGVYLNPVGVANAASFAPVTASLAPGELITLYGSGLSAGTTVTQGGSVFPTSLGGVSVTVNGVPCPIYYVSATQLAVIVPYAPDPNKTSLANIQVTNNGAKSNVVQLFLSDTAPGVFSQTSNGLGYGAVLHAASGIEVTKANPATAGEYLAVFLTGLGSVTPAVADGALGPANPLSKADQYTAGNLTVYFNDYGNTGSTGNSGTIQYAGLAPSLAGLYQVNVQVPATGLTSGDDAYIEISTDSADINQISVPYGSAAARIATPQTTQTVLRNRRRIAPKTHPRMVRGASQ
jgi:uncharacterized protein (TIGR03437 family)